MYELRGDPVDHWGRLKWGVLTEESWPCKAALELISYFRLV